MTADLISLAGEFGAPGLLVVFMVWDRRERNKLDADRTKADIEMATAMTLLAERLNHVR